MSERSGSVEMFVAIVLSCATLLSTWCGYQAKEWAYIQGSLQSAADTAEREAVEFTIISLQLRTFDGIEVLALWNAIRQDDAMAVKALRLRMRPQLQAAVEASLAAGILEDPTVAGPMQRPEYVLAEELRAKQGRENAMRLNSEASEAGRAAGQYVMLTLMFASVLFFGGIASSFTHRRIRIGLAGVSLLLFLWTMGMLIQLPLSVNASDPAAETRDAA